jgi:DNA helicase HerA-like ATPase
MQVQDDSQGGEEEQVYPLDPSLALGVVCDSGVATVKVMLEGNASGQVSDYVLIEAGELVIFGQISAVSLEEAQGGKRVPMALVAMLNTIDFEKGSVLPGVSSRPSLGGQVYLAQPLIVRMVAESRSKSNGVAAAVSFDLARLSDGYDTRVAITPEMLFGRHMAILGTTGGGKSYTLMRLLEEVAKHKSKTILFDPSGEFGAIEHGALHVYLGAHPSPAKNQYAVSVPYYQLTENDLFAIFKPGGEAQAPKLRQAIKSLKLAKLAPHITVGGYIVKGNREKRFFDAEYMTHVSALEGHKADFDISKLVRQISNECVMSSRSSTEPGVWGDINQMEMSHVVPLTNRFQEIVTSGNMAPICQPGELPSLFTVMDKFVESDEYRVLVVSLQYLSFEHSAREIVANAAGRYLMSEARAERFREMPVLVAVDEAHQFLKEKNEANSEYSMDSFALIAKEGRKYGLHMCIATQRPRDIPESVLSQMGSLIVHRLINDQDRGIIERACGEANATALSSLPILTQGQAVLLGADFPVPLMVKVRMPEKRPHSRSADFQRCWNWGKK